MLSTGDAVLKETDTSERFNKHSCVLQDARANYKMRVLIADDHEVVRKGVRSVLQTQPSFYVCGEAVDGQDAIEKVKLLRPDLVLMDVSMPNLDGLNATREIRNIFPEIEVVILSHYETPQMAEQAFHAGARGYVVKSSISNSLFSALEHVSRHESFLDPCIIWFPGQADPQVDLTLERSRFFFAMVNPLMTRLFPKI